MRIKGSALIPMTEFIKKNHGQGGLEKWLNALSTEAKETFSGNILSSAWYDLKTQVAEPTEAYCKLFSNGDVKGAWELGRFSADFGLKGIFRVFVKFGSPKFIINRASTILPKYYEGAVIKVVETNTTEVLIQITQFSGLDPTVEARIGGWMERALEICGGKDVKLILVRSMTKGAPMTEFKATWS